MGMTDAAIARRGIIDDIRHRNGVDIDGGPGSNEQPVALTHRPRGTVGELLRKTGQHSDDQTDTVGLLFSMPSSSFADTLSVSTPLPQKPKRNYFV